MRLWGLKLTNLGHFFCKMYFLYVWRSRKNFLALPSLPISTSGSPRRSTWSKCQDWGENVRIEVLREIRVKFIDRIASLIKMSGLRWNCQKWGAAAAVPSVYCWKELHTSVKISFSIYLIFRNTFNHPSHFSEITFMTLIQYNRWTAASWDSLSRRQEQIDTLPKPEEK